MQYSEAFKSLGYILDNPRQDWTAASPDGVCITLWTKEIRGAGPKMHYDSREYSGPLEDWIDKPGNKKRIVHLSQALGEFDGWIDVVRVDGVPGESYGDAEPWNPTARKGFKWRVTSLDSATGHFRTEIQNQDIE